MRLFHWDIIRTLIWQYIRRNDYYVFYLHPFEMTREKVPQLKNLGWADRYYLHHGIGSYRYKIEQIICMLKKCGYEFVTFEELVGILENAHKDKA